MEIAGYEIDDKVLAGGAIGLVVLGVVLSRRGDGEDSETAFLKPAEGLSWKDILGGDPTGRLVGPGGPSGPPGPPPIDNQPPPDNGGPGGPGGPGGGPGTRPKCSRNADCGPDKRCVGGRCQKKDDGNKGGDECRDNNDCRSNQKCRQGKCVKRDDGGNGGGNRGDGGGGGGHRNDRPKMPNNRNDKDGKDNNKKDVDVRLDDPKDKRRREHGNNRLDRGNGGDSERADREKRDREERDHNNRARGGRVRTGNISGDIAIDVSGGRARDHGKHARAEAKGGNVKTGDVDKNTKGNINASGGNAVANASGGNGNRTGRNRNNKERKQRDDDTKNRTEKQRDEKKTGRAGYGIAGLDSDGYGRLDGSGGTARGFVRTNVSVGGSSGGFVPMPQALGGTSIAVQKGETLQGLSKRATGYSGLWPRLVTLNQDVLLPGREIPAGTKLRV